MATMAFSHVRRILGVEPGKLWEYTPGLERTLRMAVLDFFAPLPVPNAQPMPAWTHCGIGVRVTQTQIWYTAMFFRNPN